MTFLKRSSLNGLVPMLGVIAWASLVADADAQVATARAESSWVGASVALGQQPKGQEECPNVCGPLGGAGIAAGLSVGVGVTPRYAGVFEVLFGPRLEGDQTFRRPGGQLALSTEHRDSFLTGGVALFLTEPQQPVEARVVGLMGLAIRRTTRVGEERSFFPTRASPYEDTVESVAPTVGGGLDLAVRAGRRISIVPSLRVHFILGDDTPDNQPPERGVGSVLLSAAVGIAIAF